MGQSVFPALIAASKTRKVETLTSGTSWTVPAGVFYVNATLIGGGSGVPSNATSAALPGQVITTTVATTPASSITYAIAAGGDAAAGGSTTFTGATTAVGGGTGAVGTAGATANNGGISRGRNTIGGAGKIEIEYWV